MGSQERSILTPPFPWVDTLHQALDVHPEEGREAAHEVVVESLDAIKRGFGLMTLAIGVNEAHRLTRQFLEELYPLVENGGVEERRMRAQGKT